MCWTTEEQGPYRHRLLSSTPLLSLHCCPNPTPTTACIYFYLSELSHTADSSTLFNGGAFSPTPNLFAAGTFVRGIHAYYWAVAISTQVTDPFPDTVPQLIFSLLVRIGRRQSSCH